MAKAAGRNQHLEVSVDVAAVLRPEEAVRLHNLRDLDRLQCAICAQWIEPYSRVRASVSISLDGDRVMVEFAHAECSASRADLARLVDLAQAEPLGSSTPKRCTPTPAPCCFGSESWTCA